MLSLQWKACAIFVLHKILHNTRIYLNFTWCFHTYSSNICLKMQFFLICSVITDMFSLSSCIMLRPDLLCFALHFSCSKKVSVEFSSSKIKMISLCRVFFSSLWIQFHSMFSPRAGMRHLAMFKWLNIMPDKIIKYLHLH